MEHFTPIASFVGGILIGLSSAMVLILNGHIAGISGIFEGILLPRKGNVSWRWAFVAGLLTGGVVLNLLRPGLFAIEVNRSLVSFALAGLLVGFGTRLGNGCTSGHGVCGLGRFSKRSFVATCSFILAGGLTVYAIQHWLGGSP